ncbi:MAG: class I SAM-dependent methyltransferase [Chloroflexia bacterium]
MTSRNYEYGGLQATTWDLFRGDTSRWDDRFFYREVVERYGQPVLDVGCGTGRILLDFMSQGIGIDGVDNSPEMLDLCREKAEKMGLRPSLYEQRMQSLDLPRKYATIIVPSSSFQLLTDLDDARAAMRRFYEQLLPGGTLVMPFMRFYEGEATEGVDAEEWRLLREKERPDYGDIVRHHTRSTYDLDAHLEHTEDHYEVVKGGEVVYTEDHKQSPATRWYSREEAVDLYADAGFTDIRLTSGFTFEPAKPDDNLVCVFGTRRP